jgi:CheY-like chemotaxis protein
MKFPLALIGHETHNRVSLVYHGESTGGRKPEDTGMIDLIKHDASGHLVLIVDDDSRIRRYIKTILQSADVQVLEASDGLEALEVFHAWHAKIDLVITDIRMPRMTGTDLALSLRSSSPAIPLIFVSGEPTPVDMVDPEKGIFSIEKPFGPKMLLDAADRVFHSSPAIACAT